MSDVILHAEEMAAESFRQEYGEEPAVVVHAPGRVNLIGEHTDYNDGFVLPMALVAVTALALRPRDDRTVRVRSLNLEDRGAFSLDNLTQGSGWLEYPKGVGWALEKSGVAETDIVLRGWDGVIASSVPVAASLSSSAAVEVAVGKSFLAASGIELDTLNLAKICQVAENDWVGMQCGIMDQYCSAKAEPGTVLMIDCRSLESRKLEIPQGVRVVILDTGTRRNLVESAYNERRRTCESVARILGVKALRDATLTQLEQPDSDLTIIQRIRARHVIREDARVLEAVDALEARDPERLGILMSASHSDLRDNYEVSSPALDTMVEIASEHPACYGARMTGAGFGGSAVALVREDRLDDFCAEVDEKYTERTRLTPNLMHRGVTFLEA